MDTRKNVQDYWKNPGSENAPAKYLHNPNAQKRSAYLVSLVTEQIKLKLKSSILEIGCNSGRNLLHLWNAGYHNLSGIEINQDAIDLMQADIPQVKADISVGSVESVIREADRDYHLIFTMAVLVHIHPDSEWIFGEMVKKTRKYIITIEDEQTNKGKRHIARNYQDVFEGLGMKQIYYRDVVPGMNEAYKARIFVKG